MNRLITAAAAVLAVLTLGVTVAASPAAAANDPTEWTHRPGHYASITVEDDTAGWWPVAWAVRAWGRGLHLGSCTPTTINCTHVYDSDGGAADRVEGYTQINGYRRVAGVAGQVVSRATVSLNDHYRGATSLNRQIVEHELGHVLGLQHDTRGGIMNPVAAVRPVRTISCFEVAELHAIYGKPRLHC